MNPTLEQIKTEESVWPDGATHYKSGIFYKKDAGVWLDSIDDEPSCNNNDWFIDATKRPTKAFVPEVGEWCESSGGAHVFYVGIDDEGGHVFSLENGGLTRYHSISDFRPIKSKRELFVEAGIEINKSLGIGATEKSMFEALYDSGKFSLKEPTK